MHYGCYGGGFIGGGGGIGGLIVTFAESEVNRRRSGGHKIKCEIGRKQFLFPKKKKKNK